MRRIMTFLLLSACVATSGTADPVSAQLSSEGLSVKLADGRTCRGGGPPEGARRWTGSLGGCPEGWTYLVVLEDRANPARAVVEAVLSTLSIEDALAPAAEVTVIDASGLATTFVSPPPRAAS